MGRGRLQLAQGRQRHLQGAPTLLHPGATTPLLAMVHRPTTDFASQCRAWQADRCRLPTSCGLWLEAPMGADLQIRWILCPCFWGFFLFVKGLVG